MFSESSSEELDESGKLPTKKGSVVEKRDSKGNEPSHAEASTSKSAIPKTIILQKGDQKSLELAVARASEKKVKARTNLDLPSGGSNFDISPVDDYHSEKRKMENATLGSSKRRKIVKDPKIQDGQDSTVSSDSLEDFKPFRKTPVIKKKGIKSKTIISIEGSGISEVASQNSGSVDIVESDIIAPKPKKLKEVGGFEVYKENQPHSIEEAMKVTKGTFKHPRDHHLAFSYKCVIAEHDCPICDRYSSFKRQCVYEPAYYSRFIVDRSRWFDSNTLTLLVCILQHKYHNTSIQIVDSSIVSEFEVYPDTKSVIAILYKDSHFAACEFVISNRECKIYDGMYPPIVAIVY
jgi:hypothetical protein